MIPLLIPISAAAANALAAAIWQGLLLSIAVALCLRLVPSITAAARSIIWTAVFAVILLLHLLPFTGANVITATEGPAIHIGSAWSLALAGMWLFLSVFRAIQFLVSAFALRRIARNAIPIAAAQTPRRYTLCTSLEIDRPSVIGFFRPRILLPPALYASLSPAELHHVLLHETEHLRRRDDWSNLLQKLALVFFPLNPALIWVERRLCLERELACDDRVLRSTGARKAYATCLTTLAEHTLLRRGVSLALGFLGVGDSPRRSELARRVHRILRAPQQALSARHSAAITATLLVGLTAGGLCLAHAPQLISFTPTQVSQVAQQQPEVVIAAPSPARAVLTSFNTGQQSVPHSSQLHRDEWVSAPKATLVTQKLSHKKPHVSKLASGLRASLPDDDPTPRLILTTASGDQVSYTFIQTVVRMPAYAAVPTLNGWLILQL